MSTTTDVIPVAVPSRRRLMTFGSVAALTVGAATCLVASQAAAQVEVANVDISASGNGARMLLGDVTGDGRLDFVMMQGDSMDDDRYIGHQVNALTAYDFEGNLLWQVGNPAQGDATGSDIPAQIYDIDGDGENEVLACMKNSLVSSKLAILDGRTGELEGTIDYPAAEAHDAIIIANFSGNERPTDIVLKDRYSNLWAMDKSGQQLFHYSGNIGHFPWPADYDYDGRDELMAGFEYLESDGTHVWTAAQEGHADCIWVGDIDQDPSNGREIALGGDDITVYSADGELVARENMPVEPQNIAIGDFRPDLPGLEIAGQDRRDRGSPGEEGIFCWSPMQEEMLFYNTRSGWGSIANMVHDWDGTGSDFISIWRGPSPPTLFDGRGEEAAVFPEGYLMNADIDGDGTQEVIIFTARNAMLFSHAAIDLEAAKGDTPRPQSKMQYNFTRYWGGEYPPEEFLVGAGGTAGAGGSGGGGLAGSSGGSGVPASGGAPTGGSGGAQAGGSGGIQAGGSQAIGGSGGVAGTSAGGSTTTGTGGAPAQVAGTTGAGATTGGSTSGPGTGPGTSSGGTPVIGPSTPATGGAVVPSTPATGGAVVGGTTTATAPDGPALDGDGSQADNSDSSGCACSASSSRTPPEAWLSLLLLGGAAVARPRRRRRAAR